MSNTMRLLATLGLSAALASAASAGTITYIVPLTGAQEAPGPGDPDGTGVATLVLDPQTNTIDWNIVVNNIVLPITGAHIHQAPAGSPGPIVIGFGTQLSGSGLVDPDVSNVIANPTGYYVNVHNSEFPGGAIRGQLPEPATLTLLLLGGAALLRRR